MNNVMAGLTIVVVVALFAVLIGFVRYLTLTLDNTGDNLVSALSVTTTIRQDCENIVGGVLELNKNLNAAAAELTTIAGSANQLVASLANSAAPATTPPPRAPSPPEAGPEPRPSPRWSVQPAAAAPPAARAPRRFRESALAAPAKDVGSTETLQASRAIGATRREFRIRGTSGEPT